MGHLELVVLVPVLKRPQNVVPLLDSIRRTTPEARVVFICDAFDRHEIEAVDAAKAERLIVTGNYAKKINRGISHTDEPLIFLGADDLRFQRHWFDHAKTAIERGSEVVGVNDLIPRRRTHTTHFLITRDYAHRGLIDGRPGVLCEDYRHSFVDDELIGTATSRGLYSYVRRSKVKHLHPMARTADLDETYEKGLATIPLDQRIFKKRESLWTSS